MKNRLHFSTCNCKIDEKQKLFKAIDKERLSIGYYALPEQNIDEVLEFVNAFDESIENIIVLGIGGSSLGAKAIYEFLKPVKKPLRKLYFFESTDPLNIMEILSKIELEKSHFLVISKSGTTVETISIFKYLYDKESSSSKYTFVTGKDSSLDKFATNIGSKVFYLADNVDSVLKKADKKAYYSRNHFLNFSC